MPRIAPAPERAAALLLASLLCGALPALAEHAPPRSLTFAEYLKAVEASSLDLQAQRETVVGAQAGISIAGVRPDPQLTFGIDSKELYNPNKPNASTALFAGIAFTLEMAGKRDKRVRAAESNFRLAEANVEGFRRQLDADAATAFSEACRAREALARRESTLRALSEIVRVNEARLKAGDVGGLELAQSRVERDRFEADVTSARAAAAAAGEALSVPLGRRFEEAFGAASLECDLQPDEPAHGLNGLIVLALGKRDDLAVARAALDNARANAELAQANRWVDPVINAGITNTPRVDPILNSMGNITNSPAERSTTLGLTVTIPLPFSREQKGELIQAESALAGATLALRAAQLKVESEVRRMYVQAAAARDNVRRYRERVLVDADKVLEGMRVSYRKGAATLLELLAAQRAADEVYLAYLQAVADLASAAVQLQLSVGQRPAL